MGKTLADVPVRRVWQAQQAAAMRVQLYALMMTHKIFGDLARTLKVELVDAAGKDGTLDGMGLYLTAKAIEFGWNAAFKDWMKMFEALRIQAAEIPFGTMAVLHEAYIGKVGKERVESRELREVEEPTFVFQPRLRTIVDAANQRLYKDNFTLSGRIWNLDHKSLEGIRAAVNAGVAAGKSAWQIAQSVEQYLGAGKDCPRWTRTRLYGLTKGDIAAGDRTGLVSGDECAGQGVAYNALRLARTEIQAILNMATVENMRRMPWVEKEQIRLSPAHPQADECDDVVNGGDKGDGVYPVGEVWLPVHPHCLCYRTAVMMEPGEFTDKLKDWMDVGFWGRMDVYAEWLGVPSQDLVSDSLSVVMAEAGGALVRWLWGGEDALQAVMNRDVPLELW